MSARLIKILPVAAVLAAAAFALPAQAGVSWSIGINAPIAPGVQVGTVIGGGHVPRYYGPAPVVYAPVYTPPPVVYVPPPPVYAPVVYGPPAVVVAPRPVYRYYRAPVIVRPGYGYYHHHHDGWERGNPGRGDPGRGDPGRGGDEPMSQVHTTRVLR